MNLFHNSHTEYISNIRFQMLDIMEPGELPGIKEIDTIRDQAGGELGDHSPHSGVVICKYMLNANPCMKPYSTFRKL